MVPRESNRLPKLDLEIPGKWKMNAEQRNKFFLLCCSTPEPTHKSTNRLSLGEGIGEKKGWKMGAKSDHDASLSVFRHFNCINAAFPITHPVFREGYPDEIRVFARSSFKESVVGKEE